MAKHEFGIMQEAPHAGKRYDEYEPWKYHCISVEDDDMEKIDRAFSGIDCYWHTTDVKGKGLAYCGVTLIPPESLGAFIDVIRDISAFSELEGLMKKAHMEHRWVIHFGI